MTSVALNDAPTLGPLLFPPDEDPTGAIAEALEEGDVASSLTSALSGLSMPGRRASIRELANVTTGLMDLPILQLLLAGWQKYDALQDAARRTAGTSLVEVVDLAVHRITSVHHPYVEILVDEKLLATMHFHLSLEFLIRALVVSVSDGRIVAFHSGDTDLEAVLSMEDVELRRFQGHLSLPLEVSLKQGIPLLEDPASDSRPTI